MSRVSYFQRFSQRENHATNNTLLILRFFNQASPYKLQSALTSLTDLELSIGLTFEQQVHIHQNVPDALITQEPFQIFVETKHGGALIADQIEKHINSIANYTHGHVRNILVGLTKEPTTPSVVNRFRALARSKGIDFVAITFSQIVEVLRLQCAEYEVDLLEIIDDYEQYLSEDKLLDVSKNRMVVFAGGDTFEDNKRFGLYYEPATRLCKSNNQFIGIYKQKMVGLVGKLDAIVVCSNQRDKLKFKCESGTLIEALKKKIIDAIESIKYHDLKIIPYRFYIVEGFEETSLRKETPGGLRSHQYLDLSEIVNNIFDPHKNYSSIDIANQLKGMTFK